MGDTTAHGHDGRRMEKPFVLFFVALIAVGILGASIVGIKGDPGRYDELFKFFLTLIQVGGLGGIAAFMLERYKQTSADKRDQAERQEANARRVDELARQMSLDARKCYDGLKRTRRLLQDDFRNKHPTPQEVATFAADSAQARSLVAHGQALLEPQLLLESLKEQAEYRHDLPDRPQLVSQFKAMEKCANKLSDALRSSPPLDVTELHTIAGFLNTDQFTVDFADRYHNVVDMLLRARTVK